MGDTDKHASALASAGIHGILGKAGRALLALLLVLLLIPVMALQPTQALADEEDAPAQEEAVIAEDDPVGQGLAPAASEEEPEAEGADAADEATGSDSLEAEDPNAGISLQDEVGIETNVYGEITFEEYWRWDEHTGDIRDQSFTRGLNKVAIDRSAHDGNAWTIARFMPWVQVGQDNVQADWDAIAPEQKYTLETLNVGTSDPEVLRLEPSFDRQDPEARPAFELRGDLPVLQFHSEKVGSVDVFVNYRYTNPDTQITYQGDVHFTAHVVDGANQAVSVEAPSNEVTVWAYGDFKKPQDNLWSAYYYQYDCAQGFEYDAREYMVACDTRLTGVPATFCFDDLFSISIDDKSVISEVQNWQRVHYNGDMHSTGCDWRTYSLHFVPKHAGTANVTISLKQDPQQKATIKVTVKDDHPEAVVADHEMQVGKTQHIYTVEQASYSDASPVYLPLTAMYLNYATSQAQPFIKEMVSSKPDVVEIKPISYTSNSTQCAPFDIIPLSVGTSDITLTDCFGKVYRYTITVKPDPTITVDPTVTIDAVELMQGSTEVTKGMVTMSTRDIAGVTLTADVAITPAGSPVTVTWKSTNTSVATVENGVVVPVRASYNEHTGKTADCRIEATVNGEVTVYCNVTVEEPQNLCGAPADSPLGAASIKLDKPLPQELLAELDSVALAIAPISAGSQDAIDSGVSNLEGQGLKTGGVFNINFVNKSDGAEHKWNKPDYPLTVKIPMSAEMRELQSHGTLAFYHIDPETGQPEKMRTWVDANRDYIYFETTHFSPFVLVAEPSSTPVTPGDDSKTPGTPGTPGGLPATGPDTPSGDTIVVVNGYQPQLRTLRAIPDADLAQTGDVATRTMAAGFLFAAGSLLLLVVANRKRLLGGRSSSR